MMLRYIILLKTKLNCLNTVHTEQHIHVEWFLLFKIPT